jgi:PRTRC genetic system ThiF family protein
MAEPGTHRLPPHLLTNPVRIAVIGCGGTGSAIAGGLPRLHQCMLALGHPYGLHVTLIDGDRVSRTNVVRQAFSAGDVGANKAEVLVHRLNLFYGLGWEAQSSFFRGRASTLPRPSIVISCLDTRAARAAVAGAVHDSLDTYYWLDCGNNDFDGQFVLGETRVARFVGWGERERLGTRLPTVADLYPEILDRSIPETAPACSAAEALRSQGPFVNEVIAHGALALLAQLLTRGEIRYHGQVINLATGRSFALPVPTPAEPKVTPAPPPGPVPRREPRVRARRPVRNA